MDPDPSWKEMKKAGKKVFQALGGLRDMQVLQYWVEKLSGDPVAITLLDHVRSREVECKQEDLKEMEQFDRKQWRQWSRSLPRRAPSVRSGSAGFKHLPLATWTAAYELPRRALHTRSHAAFH